MPDPDQVTAWMDAYRQAWNSNDSDDIGRLFAEDAHYYTAPFRDPWRGRAAIVAGWLARKDEPGQAQFAWHLVAVTGDLAVVHGTTTYVKPPATYSNLWLVRLDDAGRCTEFTEWWMQHPSS
jgi:uncharacterized protein (TIGR02246 family)